jgi:hypothetical protein
MILFLSGNANVLFAFNSRALFLFSSSRSHTASFSRSLSRCPIIDRKNNHNHNNHNKKKKQKQKQNSTAKRETNKHSPCISKEKQTNINMNGEDRFIDLTAFKLIAFVNNKTTDSLNQGVILATTTKSTRSSCMSERFMSNIILPYNHAVDNVLYVILTCFNLSACRCRHAKHV